jgi:ubiquinone/menaquinone biosynthesis C-methylase UbiE
MIMDIYKGLLFISEGGPEKYFYEGVDYYRYMDKLYIPKPPSELNQADVSALSEMRLKLGDEVIDLNYSLDVVKYLVSLLKLNSNSKVIDFGCGGGMLCNYLKESNSSNLTSEILGLDISSFAVKEFMNNHHDLDLKTISAVYFDGLTKLEYPDNYFDGVISSFVMHFNIFENQMAEMFRVLKPNGRFVYNDYVYHKYKGQTKKLILMLKNIGFEIEESVKSFKHPETKDIKNHKIITAIKPASA